MINLACLEPVDARLTTNLARLEPVDARLTTTMARLEPVNARLGKKLGIIYHSLTSHIIFKEDNC